MTKNLQQALILSELLPHHHREGECWLVLVLVREYRQPVAQPSDATEEHSPDRRGFDDDMCRNGVSPRRISLLLCDSRCSRCETGEDAAVLLMRPRVKLG